MTEPHERKVVLKRKSPSRKRSDLRTVAAGIAGLLCVVGSAYHLRGLLDAGETAKTVHPAVTPGPSAGVLNVASVQEISPEFRPAADQNPVEIEVETAAEPSFSAQSDTKTSESSPEVTPVAEVAPSEGAGPIPEGTPQESRVDRLAALLYPREHRDLALKEIERNRHKLTFLKEIKQRNAESIRKVLGGRADKDSNPKGPDHVEEEGGSHE